MNPKKVKIKISAHATKRILQRYRLFMTPTERENPESFLIMEFRKSYEEIQNSPFYKRVNEYLYGIGAFHSRSKNLLFAGTFDEKKNSVFIKSVWKIDKNNKNKFHKA